MTSDSGEIFDCNIAFLLNDIVLYFKNILFEVGLFSAKYLRILYPLT